MKTTDPNKQTELEKAIEYVNRHCYCTKDAVLMCMYCRVTSAARRAQEVERERDEAERLHDEEIGEFQNKVKNLIDKMADSNVDGGGCESGDWRDFTLSEIGQGMAHVIDERDDLKHQLSSTREALKLAAEALHKIKEMNGPGLDLSPANQEYKIAETALSHPAIQEIFRKGR